ncbi:hypothetical protein OL548_18755 [Lysinibacillus sp. MHQ-1]|nr:hypothetical protein OL548_18755 [Lysinibacillus sp. MHQ-1]
MIRNKKAFVTAIILLGICMCLFFPFPNYQMLNARISFMSFPILKDDGYVLLGILGSVLFILAVILLVKGIKKIPSAFDWCSANHLYLFPFTSNNHLSRDFR